MAWHIKNEEKDELVKCPECLSPHFEREGIETGGI